MCIDAYIDADFVLGQRVLHLRTRLRHAQNALVCLRQASLIVPVVTLITSLRTLLLAVFIRA